MVSSRSFSFLKPQALGMGTITISRVYSKFVISMSFPKLDTRYSHK